MSIQSPRSRALQSLPDELLLEIVRHLETSAKLALRWTCRQYYMILCDIDIDLVPGPSKQQRQISQGRWVIYHREAARQMLLVERWPYYNSMALREQETGKDGPKTGTTSTAELPITPLDLFFCKSCWKLRPVEKFLTSMTSRSRKSGKMSSPFDRSQDRAYARLCIDCCIRRYDYKNSTTLRFGQPELTGRCGYGIVCKRCSRFVEVEIDSKERLRRTCAPCLAYRPPGTR